MKIYIPIAIIISLIFFLPSVAATTWYVDDDGGADFTTIRDAINAAEEGDTIHVMPGIYSWFHVLADEPNLTITGEGADLVTVDCSGVTFEIWGDETILDGLTIFKATTMWVYGQDCIIRNCVFDGMTGSTAMQIEAPNCTFENNRVQYLLPVTTTAVNVKSASSRFINNTFIDIPGVNGALYIRTESTNAIIENNLFENCTGSRPLTLSEVTGCTVANNTFKDNTGDAIRIWKTTAVNNVITGNSFGDTAICFRDAGNGNRIYLNNNLSGAVLYAGSTPPTTAYWNATEPVAYTYNGVEYTGYPGNFWSSYTGDDADGDGIIDTPYILPDSLGTDYEPLVGTWSDGEILGGPTAPTANFTADVTTGDAPLTVQFTDLSTGDGITDWAWDFENDGTVDDTNQSPSHIYDIAGTYTVNLTVTNAGGSDEEVKVDYITVTPAGTPTISFVPDSTAIGVGSTQEYLVVINTLPAGLAGFRLNATLENPAVGTITALTVPAWAILNWSSALPADSIAFSTVDLEKQVEPGAINITIGTITVRGDAPGTTNISTTMAMLDADGGDAIVPLLNTGKCVIYQPLAANFTAEPLTGTVPLTVNFTDLSTGDPLPATWAWDFENDGTVDSTEQNPSHTYNNAGTCTVNLTITNEYNSDSVVKTSLIQVKALVEAFPGYPNPPADPDGDGLFEDINGNGRLDFDDVVVYYQNMQWIRDNPNVGIGPYDFNYNGRIDFDDVVVLYDRVLSG